MKRQTNQEKSNPRGAFRAARRPNRKDFCAQNGTGGFRWEKKIFVGGLVLGGGGGGGLASIFCKGMAEFPPPPPSAIPLLGRTGFLAATILSNDNSSNVYTSLPRLPYIALLALSTP